MKTVIINGKPRPTKEAVEKAKLIAEAFVKFKIGGLSTSIPVLAK